MSHLIRAGSESKHFRNTFLKSRTLEMIPESIALLEERATRDLVYGKGVFGDGFIGFSQLLPPFGAGVGNLI